MQTENRFFDDFAKLMNGLAGTAAGLGREFEANAKEKARGWVGGFDFVSRDEFEAMKAIALAAREEVDVLKARLDKLEAASGGTTTPEAPVKKAATRKAPSAKAKPAE